MFKVFDLYPAVVELNNTTLTIRSDVANLVLHTEWLKKWQLYFKTLWPQVLEKQQDKGNMQIMLEGESGLVLLPLLIAQHTPFSKHIVYSNDVYLSASDWEQVEAFYQQAGFSIEEMAPVFSSLRRKWPLALPGVHRLDADVGGHSLTLGLGAPAHLQQQWLCSIDVFVRDEQEEQRQWPWVMRYAGASCCLMMNDSHRESAAFLAAVKKAGLQVEGFYATRPYIVDRQQVSAKSKKGSRSMALIGGGIAGAGIAAVMSQRGWQITVFDPVFVQSTACKHEGHIAAAMTPFVSVDDNHKSRLSRNAILRALYHWRDFPDEVIVSRSGNLEVNRDKGYGKDITLAVDSLAFPEAWVQRLSPQEASKRLGFELKDEGIFWPMGRLISPERLLKHIYQQYPIERRAQAVARVEKRESDGYWLLYDEDEQLLGDFEQVVIANAADCLSILQKSELLQRQNVAGNPRPAMPKIESTLHWMGGEVMHVQREKLKQVPKVPLGGQGYFLPPTTEGVCVLGSTYRHGVQDPGVTLEGQQVIKDKMAIALTELMSAEQPEAGWSGGRAVVQGRLPVICELDYAQNLWLAVGYGSHGLTWSSFAGDIIGSILEGEPVPLERDLFKAIGLR